MMIRKSDTEPVRLSDGSLANFLLQVGEHDFHCRCGCNVFYKPDDKQLDLYECSCGDRYGTIR